MVCELDDFARLFPSNRRLQEETGHCNWSETSQSIVMNYFANIYLISTLCSPAVIISR